MLAICGCAAPAASTGYFLAPEYKGAAAGLGADAGKRLRGTYGADRTWQLTQSPTDAFGKALSQSLRQHGNRVLGPENTDATALPLAYTVDRLKGTKMVRVMLTIEALELTRVYSVTSGTPAPAGPWMAQQEGP